jgi:acyl-CoA thioester hydrolase
MEVFTKTIKVSPDDLDELQHVNNVRYVQWIQDISREHWLSVATPELLQTTVWVVRKHEIEYKRPALLGEAIRIRTYITDTRGPLSTRVVEMCQRGNTGPLLSSRTTWCLLNAKTLRPMRIPREISTLFMGNGGN